MAVIALHSAATGLTSLSTSLDVIANNLANVNTPGFKSSRVNFEDLIYEHREQPGVENANGDQRPAGLQVGLGVKVSNTQYDFSPGSPIETEQDLDLMIAGAGFFEVEIVTEDGGGVGFTRAGNFNVNADGEMVLGTRDGYRLVPGITIPEGTVSVEVASDGTVYAVDPENDLQEIGQIQLTNFINSAGLKSIGGNIYVETAASGPPVQGTPGEGNLGTIEQGFIENSNVNMVRELVSLIKTQRAFELNSQTIQAADSALEVVGNLRRF
ncbi:flagellar basal-body rod protein FlgG [Mucisphaera calidilacus]|uniref:Flagellar basal-body rod protein FlgG n=1 Tax=Mucisphaera calidilacus TaxID=2527982 RepID=A0A518BZH4_9BACT|nr:flagellar basal-body rod protein FlgG [Mucisphaera calidilacus]QDU72368.1 Flagellar basal-body rod protein FlgG [Mucisphaera calidilacus]